MTMPAQPTLSPEPGEPNLPASSTPYFQALRQHANDYMVPMSDDSLASLANTIANLETAPKDEKPTSEKTAKKNVTSPPEPMPGDNTMPAEHQQAMQAFENLMKERSMGLYPTMASQIQSGLKPAQLVDSYAQIAKQLLGPQVQPDFVNDAKWQAALTGGRDPKTGAPAPMGLAEWKQKIKSDPQYGWQYTPQAHARANEIAQAILHGFSTPGGPQ